MKPRALILSSAALSLLAVALLLAGPVLSALVFGWMHVMERAVPRIEVNVAGVATGLACIAAVVIALHYFAGWLYAEVRLKQARTDWPASWRWKWTLCLIAAVMLMFSAGLAGVGLCRTTSWFLQTPVIFTRTNSFS